MSYTPNLEVDLSDYRSIFVIGDIHGEYDRLRQFLSDNGFSETSDAVVSVGDLVDRGPKSFECLELIYKSWFYGVLGNHEDMMYSMVAHGYQGNLWYRNGGDWFEYLTEAEKDEARAYVKDIPDKLPLTLTATYNNMVFGVVHAEPPRPAGFTDSFHIPWFEGINNVDEAFALWSRVDVHEIIRRLAFQKPDCDLMRVIDIDHVFCGHTPVKYPIHSNNIHWIDTGAVYRGDGGYFTAVKIEKDLELQFLKEEVR